MKDSASAIKTLADFVRKNPGDAFSKFALALEMLKRDVPEKALVLFESVRSQDPGYPGLAYHLGKLYQRLGRLDEAADLLQAGITQARQRKDSHALGELEAALFELNLQRELEP